MKGFFRYTDKDIQKVTRPVHDALDTQININNILLQKITELESRVINLELHVRQDRPLMKMDMFL